MAKSLKANGRPSFQFYPDDWLKEPALRLCSLAAKGLWMDMLCIMWFGQPRGALTVNGNPLDSKGLAKTLGEKVDLIDSLLVELESNKIYSTSKDNVIYCRRMYREWHDNVYISEVRSNAGKKGAQKRWQNHGKSKAKMAASTSFSSSPSSSKNICVGNGKRSNVRESNLRSGGPKHISALIPGALGELPPEAKTLPSKTQEILKRGINQGKETEQCADKQQKDAKNKESEKEK